jgi:hypothetical protein
MNLREQGLKVRDAVSELASQTRYIISDGTIFLKVPSGITGQQRALVRENREALYCYLTTPPPATGQCRRGHPVTWRINEYGVWVCGCYWSPPDVVFTSPVKVLQQDFWQ